MIPVVPYRVALSLTEPAVRCNVRCFNRQHYRQTSPLLTQPSGFKFPTQTQINWIPFGTRSIQAIVFISTFVIKPWNIYYMYVSPGRKTKQWLIVTFLHWAGPSTEPAEAVMEIYWRVLPLCTDSILLSKKKKKERKKRKKGTEKKTFWMIQTKQTVRKSSFFLDVCITSIICVIVW